MKGRRNSNLAQKVLDTVTRDVSIILHYIAHDYLIIQ